MPGCVLRVSGAAFDVDGFLKESTFKADIVYRKGQRRRPASRGAQTTSGFNVVITESDDPKEQVKRAQKFLKDNRSEMLRLMRNRGVDRVVLEISCPQQEFLARTAHLPSTLLSTTGALGIDIDVSFYLVG